MDISCTCKLKCALMLQRRVADVVWRHAAKGTSDPNEIGVSSLNHGSTMSLLESVARAGRVAESSMTRTVVDCVFEDGNHGPVEVCVCSVKCLSRFCACC